MREYVYIVQMDIPPEFEAEFNRIYDTQHLPEMMKVPGVLSIKRYAQEKSRPGVPKFAAFYYVASDDVAESAAWVAASDVGEWKIKIRPHTFNVTRSLYKLVS